MNVKKSALLAALMPSTTPVQVDGFGTVNIKQLTVAETDDIRRITKLNKDAADSEFGLRMLIACAMDEDNAPLFDETDLPDLRNSGGSKVDALIASTVAANKIAPLDATAEQKNAQS